MDRFELYLNRTDQERELSHKAEEFQEKYFSDMRLIKTGGLYLSKQGIFSPPLPKTSTKAWG